MFIGSYLQNDTSHSSKRSNTRARFMSSKRQQANSFTRAVKSSIIKVVVVVAKELQAMHGMLRITVRTDVKGAHVAIRTR